MSERNFILLMEDIKGSIIKILEYTKELSFEAYEKDSKTKDAVERNFEIIGEAASRLSDEFKSQYPTIEWRILKDFRNFIIHEYFGVDNSIVWDTIQFSLPQLLLEINLILQTE